MNRCVGNNTASVLFLLLDYSVRVFVTNMRANNTFFIEKE
jgi:hypothetical protein